MNIATTPSLTSLLAEPERHSLRPPESVSSLGRVVVAAPHPDDESLGCGGLLALLAEAGQVADVIVLTDGTRSHPKSRSHPRERLAALREEETIAALAALGCPASAAHFLRFGDCTLPTGGTPAFAEAAVRLREVLNSLAPDTMFAPWRRDPHCDHEATWHLLRAAILEMASPPRWLEYPVWAWTQPEGEVAPRAEEAAAWRLDISPVTARKQQAIAQHRSQLGAIIHDDPDGFTLKPEMLRHFAHPWELFLEPHDV